MAKKKNTNISKDDVIRIAGLAKLRLDKGEVSQYQKELGAILDFVNKINEVDTKGVKPTFQVNSTENVFDDDQVKDCEPGIKKKIIENFPDRDVDLLKIPPVL